MARFATGIAVAVERGTPLADVLHAQAADVREAGRRELIESAARKEVLMMAPVVFFVLPITIVFAFYPGGSASTSPRPERAHQGRTCPCTTAISGLLGAHRRTRRRAT